MMPDDPTLSLWLGLVGSILVALPGLFGETRLFNNQWMNRSSPQRSRVLQELIDEAKARDAELRLTVWNPAQSLCLGIGAAILAASYLLQLFC